MKRIIKIVACLLFFCLLLANLSEITITANANNSSSVSNGDAITEATGDFLEDAKSVVDTSILSQENVCEEILVEYASAEEQSALVASSGNRLEVGDVFYDNKGLFRYEVIAEGEVAIYYTGSRIETNIEIPQIVTYAGNDYYAGSNYVVTHIARESFSDCRNLTSIIIPNSVTYIEEYAFAYCNSLKSIEIPDSVTTIGDSAFYCCSSMTNVVIPDSVTTIGDSAFQQCGLTEVVIPAGITNIERHTFAYTNLKSIEIPDGVTTIGDGAFIGCSSLANVVIPDSVTTIGDEAFRYCGSLTEVAIPDSVTEILDCAFEGCHSLVSVDIPKGIQILGSWAVYCGDQLERVRFKGDAPASWANDVFGPKDREITVYYPVNNATWTEEIKQEFSSYVNITWIPWDPETGEAFEWGGFDATFYLTNDTKYYVFDDETFAFFSGMFKAVQKGNVNEEADAIVWESSDALIADINHVLYIPDTGNMYGDDNAYSSAFFYLYMDCYKPGIVTITGTSADGRTVSATINIEPKLIASESTRIRESSDVMLCKVELAEKTDEQLAFLQNFLDSLEVNIVKGSKWDLNPICLYGDDFIGVYTHVDADSVNGRITIEVTSPGGQVVQIDVLVSGVLSDNTVVYYDENGDRQSQTFDYSIDSCLEKDSTEYNPDLAYMLVALANSAYHKEGLDFTLLKDADSGVFPDNPLAITESLRNLGFDAENGDVREYNYYSSASDSNYGDDKTAFTLATKSMSDGTTLIAIVVRGSYGDIKKLTSDWRSNINFINLGVGLHEGFNNAANEIIQELNAFKYDQAISDDNVTYVITGHSRGAAVANLVSKKLIDSGVPTNNVYDYNFACPDTGRDYAINWNSNGKYNSLYNINNVRDIVGVIPGYLFTTSMHINDFLFERGLVFWGKYGHTYFFSENWNSVTETMIGGIDQHAATLYLENMSKKQSTSSFKSWEQARLALVANTVRGKNGKILGFFCPVDIEIIDKDGIKVAEVVNNQPQYYSESLGDVVIITAGDQSLVYINGKNDYFVKITGYDTGEMTYCVSDAVLGSEYGKEITYMNVPISQGKTMISILDNDEQSDKVTLVLFDEELNPVKQIDYSGAEQELSDELKEEYSNLPLEKTSSNGHDTDNNTSNNTDTNANANTNTNNNANINNVSDNSPERDSVPQTGDSANSTIPLMIISILIFGVVYVRKVSKRSTNTD